MLKNIQFKKINKAFSLVEILIVVIILGIIAAIMLSTIKPKVMEEETLKKLAEKIFLDLDNATQMIIASDCEKYLQDIVLINNETYANYYKKYLKVTDKKTGGDNCFFVKSGANICVETEQTINNKNNCYVAYTNNATSNISEVIYPNENTSLFANTFKIKSKYEKLTGAILFDVNGNKKPNQLGKDIYRVPLGCRSIITRGN